MKRLFLILLLGIISITTIHADNITPHYGEVADGYNFWFYDPEGGSAAKPVVIFLHGSSLCGSDLNRVKRYGTIDAIEQGRELDAYVIAPQNPGGSWKPDKIMNVLEWARTHFNVDDNRVYVLGMSLGGYGTLDLCAAYPDRIAAAMAFCGGMTSKNYSNLTQVPLWIVHGTADRAVSITQSDKVAEGIRSAGDDSRLIYNRVAGMNHSRPARYFYLKESYDWLLSHSLKDPDRRVNRDLAFSSDKLGSAYGDLDRSKRSYRASKSKSASSKKSSKKSGKKHSKKHSKKSSGKKHSGKKSRK
jgi:dienelactone hydrolase